MQDDSTPSVARRVTVQGDPFEGTAEPSFWGGVQWPARWIALAGDPQPPLVSAYRCVVDLEAAQTVRVHVSADERYELFLDGQRLGRGPERGDALRWRFETYDLDLTAGRHTFVARVWAFGAHGHLAPGAQMSVRPGFLLAAEGAVGERLSTGRGPWEGIHIAGHVCVPPDARKAGHYAGGTERIDGRRYPWGVERGAGEGWGAAKPVEMAQTRGFDYSHTFGRHVLTPAKLPRMLDEPVGGVRVRFACGFDPSVASTETLPVREADHDPALAQAWQALFDGNGGDRRTGNNSNSGAVKVPAGKCIRVIVDLDNYYCAYPEVVMTGGAGASVSLHWAESLFLAATPGQDDDLKGNRGEIEGKVFRGRGDTFVPDGGAARSFAPLWWRAGRYVELVLRTGDAELQVNALHLRETRYPLPLGYELQTSDAALDAVQPLMIRALLTGMHGTYTDCPYYEQLQYVGDTRLECLTTYTLSADDRLSRQAILAYHGARRHDGLIPSRYPCYDPQVIPGFALWWVGMVHDFMMWRGDTALVKEVMPTVRSVVEAFLIRRGADGLVGAVPGWNFVDWVPAWEQGVPPGAQTQASAVINWQLVAVLGGAAELEDFVGEPHMAERCRAAASELATALCGAFFVESRGLFADDLSHTHFSEHAQIMALLSRKLDPAMQRRVLQGLAEAPGLAQATIYFSHYLFEVCHRFGLAELFFERIEALWLSLSALGVKTTLESPEPARSDNHGWGAHPLFHQFATVLGIRPASPGCATVRITPMLGRLERIRGVMPTVHGTIRADLRRAGGQFASTITLPEGVSGELVLRGEARTLVPGDNALRG